jgi:hypothetical protein
VARRNQNDGCTDTEKATLNMSLGSPCFIHYTFFFRQKAKLMVSGILVRVIRIFGLPDVGLEEFCSTLNITLILVS